MLFLLFFLCCSCFSVVDVDDNYVDVVKDDVDVVVVVGFDYVAVVVVVVFFQPLLT